MTPDQIANIQHLRGCNVPWDVIAKQLGHSVAECRQAIGMPVYSPATERPAMPWEAQQRALFNE